MLNWILSIMVHKGILVEEEAKHLAEKLAQSIHSADFASSHQMIEKLLNEFDKNNK